VDRDAVTPRFLRGDRPLDDDGEAGARPREREGTVLSGLAAGAGSVTATARVVTEVSGLGGVAAGEILVAYQTDPGWTPLFSRIGGLVLETGSVLAHGASLAREYGLPAVTAVVGATQNIPDGALVTVDGRLGTVVIHDTSA
jgi:pyruvate,water dikinase